MAIAAAGMEPEAGLCRSRIYQAISEARASLADPSRPFAPADPSRKLFRQPSVGDTLSRPTSVLSISEARASLAEPSRPFTPADPSRKLFQRCQISAGELSRPTSSASDSLSRPTSSFNVGSAAFSGEPVPPPKRIGGAEVFSVNDSDVTELHQASWWASVESSLCELHPSAPLATLLRACDRLWEALRDCGVAGPPMGGATVPAAELGRRSRRLVGGATSMLNNIGSVINRAAGQAAPPSPSPAAGPGGAEERGGVAALRDFQAQMRDLQGLLHDQQTTDFVIVTIPTGLAIAESERLLLALREEGIAVNNCVLNRLVSDDVADGYLGRLAKGQQGCVVELEELAARCDVAVTKVPYFDVEVRSAYGLRAMGSALFDGGAAGQTQS